MIYLTWIKTSNLSHLCRRIMMAAIKLIMTSFMNAAIFNLLIIMQSTSITKIL